MKLVSICLIIIILFAFQSHAAKFRGWCVKVLDGDLIIVYVNKKMLKVRVGNIDCPEPGQPFEKEAKEFTSTMVLKKKVTVEIKSSINDRFFVGRVFVDEKDLSMELVKAGLAWYYKFHGSDRYLSKAYKKARRSKVGLWSQSKPKAPWVFREEKEKKKSLTDEGSKS